MAIIPHWKSFYDASGNNIPDCTIDSDAGITVAGAIENTGDTWKHITLISILVWKKVSSVEWKKYGNFYWRGTCALDVGMCDINSNSVMLPAGVYKITNPYITFGSGTPQYYCTDPITLNFQKL